MQQSIEHEHNRSFGGGVRRVGQDDLHLRSRIRSAVHGQVVQRTAGVLQVRAEGTAAHQGVSVARNKRGRKCAKMTIFYYVGNYNILPPYKIYRSPSYNNVYVRASVEYVDIAF